MSPLTGRACKNKGCAVLTPAVSSVRLLLRVSIYQIAAVLVMSLASLWLWPNRAIAVLSGGGLMALSFWALRFFAAGALTQKRAKLAYGIGLAIKLVVVMALVALFILVLKLDVLGFAIGMSSLFFGIGLATLHEIVSRAPESSSTGRFV